ncbi:Rod shape-determining protein MreD [Marinobacterium lacunae]|uniref:Rod shape-determining protein MreD n=1 Tax=Marinobacterium lacunae TaxID=1232683 RepID=A0A081FXL9_9GAMM|nr:rod shape-determining protein MreD [Marinobacterium lacunae]KEA63274.1 Rod shape-determining protein MreD [Marinobacterium lacunae]MBR9882838.1 rod shape-determining protein MreD [Oceanospirillales bacterium]
MNEERAGGGLIILGTFIIGLVLSQIPMPDFMTWARPEWVLLVLIYWVMALPYRIGIGSAFVVGLAMDLVRGSVLGLNALSMTIIAFLVLMLYKRMRMFPLWQQSSLILVLVGINQLLFHWMQGITGTTSDSLLFLLPAVISALVWPWLFLLLRGVRRLFRIR